MKPELPIAWSVAGIIFLNTCADSHTDPHLEVFTPVNSVAMHNYQQVSSSSRTVTKDISIPLEYLTGLASDHTVNLEWF